MTAKECEMVLLVQADFDGELDAAQAASLQGHVAGCAVCQAAQEHLRIARQIVTREASYRAAPDSLRRALAGRAAAPKRERQPFWRQLPSFSAGLAMAAAIALLVVPSHDAGLVDSIVSGHVRALQPGHLIDVVSTDQHTVRPWFDGKIDFAPPVRNLADRGFPLIGGRIDYLADRPVAALVYQGGKHVINLFVWPEGSGPELDPARTSHNGYNVEHWGKDGMTYWAVSDLSAAELAQFHEAWRETP